MSDIKLTGRQGFLLLSVFSSARDFFFIQNIRPRLDYISKCTLYSCDVNQIYFMQVNDRCDGIKGMRIAN